MTKLPPNLSAEFLNMVFQEDPIPIIGGVSLEGQQTGVTDFKDPRQAYALSQIAHGNVMNAIFQLKEWDRVDPARNITANHPPTFIVHGVEDSMVPIDLSRDLFTRLVQHDVKCGMTEIPDEGHTFAAKMRVGSRTWKLQQKGFDFLESLIKSEQDTLNLSVLA